MIQTNDGRGTAAIRRVQAWIVLASLFLTLVVGRAGAATSGTNQTQQTQPAQRIDYSTFKIVTDRNIFNVNRMPGRPDFVRTETTRRTPRVENVALVGVLEYEAGAVAFFDGSSSEFRKALKTNSAIAGHKITAITYNSVKLEAGGKKVDLKLGMQLRREDEGEWQLTAYTGSGASYASSSGRDSSRFDRGSRDSSGRDSGGRDSGSRYSSGRDSGSRYSGRDSGGSTPTPSTPAATSGDSSSTKSSADVSDVLKRLMEQRDKETK